VPNLKASPIYRHAYHRAADYGLLCQFTRRRDLRTVAEDHGKRAELRIATKRRQLALDYAALLASPWANHARG
jgi:hypothetical protein